MGDLRRIMPASSIFDVDVFRVSTELPGKGGLPLRTYGAAIATDVETAISKLTGDEANRVYGIDTEEAFELLYDNATDIAAEDLVEVKTGPFAGKVLEVKDVKPGVGLIQLAGAEDSRRRP